MVDMDSLPTDLVRLIELFAFTPSTKVKMLQMGVKLRHHWHLLQKMHAREIQAFEDVPWSWSTKEASKGTARLFKLVDLSALDVSTVVNHGLTTHFIRLTAPDPGYDNPSPFKMLNSLWQCALWAPSQSDPAYNFPWEPSVIKLFIFGTRRSLWYNAFWLSEMNEPFEDPRVTYLRNRESTTHK